MNSWIYIFLFFFILFTYIHIQHQWKKGEDLEIYEYEYQNTKHLQETCLWKQPFLFAMTFPKENHPFDPLPTLYVKDIRDRHHSQNQSIEMISLNNSSAKGLLHTDTKGVFYSHRNGSTIRDQPIWRKWFETWDPILKPPFTVYCEYDILYGSRKARTITACHYESHVFLYVPPETNANPIRVKMTPYKSEKYLHPIFDYAHYEIWSHIDLYAPHEHMRCLEFLLNPGYVLYIPPYWFYGIEFQHKENEICIVKYHTAANLLANTKHIALYYMQQQNIEEKWWKPIQNIEGNLLEDDAAVDMEHNTTEEILEDPPLKNTIQSSTGETHPDEVQDVVDSLIENIRVKN